jgi:hypothetical protein
VKKIFIILVSLAAVFSVAFIALPTALHKAGLHPEYTGENFKLPGKRALVITTSHAVLAAPGENDGPATGVWGSELTHPHYTFLDLFATHVVVEDEKRFVTGQNQNSGLEAAHKMMAVIAGRQ